MIDNLKTSGKWEKHLIVKLNFLSTSGSVVTVKCTSMVKKQTDVN